MASGAANVQAGSDPLASVRLELARLAIDAALSMPEVIAGHGGPVGLYVTRDGDRVLSGVIVTATSDGRYGVELFLTATVVPLHPLAARVRAAVAGGAKAAGLESCLGKITLKILDVEDPSRSQA